MTGFTVVTLIAERQDLARFLPVQRERDGAVRQQRRLEFDVLYAVKAPAGGEQGSGVVHHPVHLRHAGQQRLHGKMTAKPEQGRVEMQYVMRRAINAPISVR